MEKRWQHNIAQAKTLTAATNIGGYVEGLSVDMDMPVYKYNNGKFVKTDLDQ